MARRKKFISPVDFQAFREDNNLSVEQLADLVGVDTHYIETVEALRVNPIPTLILDILNFHKEYNADRLIPKDHWLRNKAKEFEETEYGKNLIASKLKKIK